MTDDYTPTTSEVREVYAADSRVFHPERPGEEAEAYAEFDRWLDEYTRTVRAAALREAADEVGMHISLRLRADWLRDRADRIEKEADRDDA